MAALGMGMLVLRAMAPALVPVLSKLAAPDWASAVRVLPPPVWMLSVGAVTVGVPATNASSTIRVKLVSTAEQAFITLTVGFALAAVLRLWFDVASRLTAPAEATCPEV